MSGVVGGGCKSILTEVGCGCGGGVGFGFAGPYCGAGLVDTIAGHGGTGGSNEVLPQSGALPVLPIENGFVEVGHEVVGAGALALGGLQGAAIG